MKKENSFGSLGSPPRRSSSFGSLLREIKKKTKEREKTEG